MLVKQWSFGEGWDGPGGGANAGSIGVVGDTGGGWGAEIGWDVGVGMAGWEVGSVPTGTEEVVEETTVECQGGGCQLEWEGDCLTHGYRFAVAVRYREIE